MAFNFDVSLLCYCTSKHLHVSLFQPSFVTKALKRPAPASRRRCLAHGIVFHFSFRVAQLPCNYQADLLMQLNCHKLIFVGFNYNKLNSTRMQQQQQSVIKYY